MTAAKRPRRLRDWLVDFALFALAVVWGIVLSGLRISAAEVPSVVPAWLFTLDQAVGALGCGALWFRRRWPTEVAVALVLLSSFSEMVSGAMLVGLFTVAVHRPPRTSLTVFALSLLAAVAYALLRPEPGAPGLLLFFIGAACQAPPPAGDCSCTTAAGSSCRCGNAQRRRRDAQPGRRSPAKSTTFSDIGCPC